MHLKYKETFAALLICGFSLFISLACSLTDISVPSAAPHNTPISVANQIRTVSNAETETDAASASVCTVNAEVLHLRSCAGTDCAVVTWLQQGETLTILQPGST